MHIVYFGLKCYLISNQGFRNWNGQTSRMLTVRSPQFMTEKHYQTLQIIVVRWTLKRRNLIMMSGTFICLKESEAPFLFISLYISDSLPSKHKIQTFVFSLIFFFYCSLGVWKILKSKITLLQFQSLSTSNLALLQLLKFENHYN